MNLFDPWCQTSKWSQCEGPKGQLPVGQQRPSVLDRCYDPFYSCPSFLTTLKTHRHAEKKRKRDENGRERNILPFPATARERECDSSAKCGNSYSSEVSAERRIKLCVCVSTCVDQVVYVCGSTCVCE